MRKPTEHREHELLAAIVAGQQARGYAPTRRELAATIGISTSRVQQIVESCIQRGYLARVPRAARAYIVQKYPTLSSPAARATGSV
ncbi:MAG: MarR family transcriptional regulator [Planctomycetes bacterium]|nr:MarR family transcriptional regulator [Planctomycetota bacterium]MBM4056936.1 MarR family transcriptional regulator [Planctomycetota bacterium]